MINNLFNKLFISIITNKHISDKIVAKINAIIKYIKLFPSIINNINNNHKCGKNAITKSVTIR